MAILRLLRIRMCELSLNKGNRCVGCFVHQLSKIGAASNGLIIIIIDECKNQKYTFDRKLSASAYNLKSNRF